ncbi:MAG: LptF/LptG family permease [Alphaproteobacteria bacterium]|nr:LptF/LptG family permease [Alphaproteobacteria bacterium]MBU1516938.1 LptF/LptG family permease [Alphaproteobacteria bacterium]MBU2095826.1 LptF/LptG family permease [Alphaproteobacteria bacterium]MBU2152037.1 LptF/LptG family permease [Alphaproteobacteria bacterium]MBU2309558.1 LptF/LptG family permease [Alphaproteobacteria bacterium]
MTLGAYLLKLMGSRILVALLVLVGILQILDLLDVTNDILDRNLGAGGVGYYALLRLPRLIEQAAPLAVLAGALFAFAKLAGDSAVTAMRSTGFSAYRLTLMAAPAAVALTLVQAAIGMQIAPRTDHILSDWWQASTPKDPSKVVDPVTFRVGDEIVVAVPRDPDGRSLEKVTIYRRDQAGRLIQRTSAQAAVYENQRWRLIEPRFETLGTASITEGQARTMDWSENLKPGDVRMLAAGETTVTQAEASRALAGGLSVRPRTFYDTQLQRAWAAPLSCLVMLLLSAPAALANFRGGGATLIIQCMTAGLLFLVFDGAFTALGENGAVPPILAAWAAPAMFSALGLSMLLHLEG